MALLTMPSDYVVGTISLANGSVDFTGTGTAWQLVGLKEGDLLIDVDGATQFWAIIDEITSNVAGKLTRPWAGPDLPDALYRMRFTSDGVRSTAQAAMLRQELGNGRVQAISTATGTSGVLEYLPGGGAQLVPKTDLINGVAVDKRVNTMDDRAAYDTQADQFSVYVADVGDAFGVENAGRAATFFRDGDTAGVWSDPAYVTGPVGPLPVIEIGATETLAPGSDATVTPTPIAGGVSLGFGIPEGRGARYVPGGYDPLVAYALDQASLDNGSTWIALQDVPPGEAPPVLPVTSNAYWGLLARKGTDGTGTGDMVGPAAATDGAPALFDGNTGKLTKEGAFATQGEAEAGAENTTFMTPLRTAQAILALSPPTDTSDLETTVSMIALQLADVSNQALFLGPTGNRVADSFDTLTYVDVAGATNLDTSTVGVLKPTQSGTVVTNNAQSGSAAVGDFTYIDRSSNLANSISVVRVGVYATTAQAMTVKIVKQNTSTNFDVLVSQAFAHPGGGWADCILSAPFAVPASGTYNLGVHCNATTDTTAAVARSTIAGNQAVGAAIAGWTVGTLLVLPLRYTHSLVPNSLTVRSATFTAATPSAKMKALLRVKEVDAAIAGTDYTLECIRDEGTTWTSMPLAEMFTTGGLLYVETAEVDVSGQPSGTSPRWRFKTLNNKNVELHDVYFYWS